MSKTVLDEGAKGEPAPGSQTSMTKPGEVPEPTSPLLMSPEVFAQIFPDNVVLFAIRDNNLAQLWRELNRDANLARRELRCLPGRYGGGVSALHLACYYIRSEHALLLLKMGANPDVCNNDSVYPIQLLLGFDCVRARYMSSCERWINCENLEDGGKPRLVTQKAETTNKHKFELTAVEQLLAETQGNDVPGILGAKSEIRAIMKFMSQHNMKLAGSECADNEVSWRSFLVELFFSQDYLDIHFFVQYTDTLELLKCHGNMMAMLRGIFRRRKIENVLLLPEIFDIIFAKVKLNLAGCDDQKKTMLHYICDFYAQPYQMDSQKGPYFGKFVLRDVLLKTLELLGNELSDELLIEFVNRADGNGRTALHLATSRFNADACQLLLGHGAKLDAKDNDGWTALQRLLNVQGFASCLQAYCEKNDEGAFMPLSSQIRDDMARYFSVFDVLYVFCQKKSPMFYTPDSRPTLVLHAVFEMVHLRTELIGAGRCSLFLSTAINALFADYMDKFVVVSEEAIRAKTDNPLDDPETADILAKQKAMGRGGEEEAFPSESGALPSDSGAPPSTEETGSKRTKVEASGRFTFDELNEGSSKNPADNTSFETKTTAKSPDKGPAKPVKVVEKPTTAQQGWRPDRHFLNGKRTMVDGFVRQEIQLLYERLEKERTRDAADTQTRIMEAEDAVKEVEDSVAEVEKNMLAKKVKKADIQKVTMDKAEDDDKMTGIPEGFIMPAMDNIPQIVFSPGMTGCNSIAQQIVLQPASELGSLFYSTPQRPDSRNYLPFCTAGLKQSAEKPAPSS